MTGSTTSGKRKALAASATAAEAPYDEKADAKSDIKEALTQAATTKTPIIVVFGANWCGDGMATKLHK